jgi:phosphoglycerate dehydrogenase-like enzyme
MFELLERAPRLRWVQLPTAGIDLPMYRPLRARGVRLATAAGVTALPIAHTVLGALLALSRGFDHWLVSQQQARWEPRIGADAPRDLAGQHAVIVGLGPIGREIARLLRALGLRTTGVRRSAQPSNDVDDTRVYAELPRCVPDADWLILCCPLGPQTERLVNAPLLAALPPQARVINVGRGRVVDEAALVEALRERRIAGAYLDVFEHEPLAADSPLWRLPGVWVSPHNAAASQGNGARQRALFERNLMRFLAGEPLENEVPAEG